MNQEYSDYQAKAGHPQPVPFCTFEADLDPEDEDSVNELYKAIMSRSRIVPSLLAIEVGVTDRMEPMPQLQNAVRTFLHSVSPDDVLLERAFSWNPYVSATCECLHCLHDSRWECTNGHFEHVMKITIERSKRLRFGD